MRSPRAFDWREGVKRVPETRFDQMCGTLWKMRPKRPEDLVALPAVPEGVRLMPEPSDKGSGQVRNLYVKKADVEGNFTPGCDGCNAIVGLPARSHSVECRTLVEQRLMETEGRDSVMRANKRKADAAGKEDKSGDVVVPAIEGMPDMAEEVAASAFVGQPARVDPLGRPPERRPMEDPAEGLHRAKSPDRRGRGPGIGAGERGRSFELWERRSTALGS